MVHFIQPERVIVETKEGEVKISLDITININTGTVEVAVPAQQQAPKKETRTEDTFLIPDFGTGNTLSFGKPTKGGR